MSQPRCSPLLLPLLAIPLLSIAGCATAVSNPSCQTPKDYTEAQRNRVADELATLPTDDPMRLFISDYGVMRSAARACLKAAK
jgi:hypothetical protein